MNDQPSNEANLSDAGREVTGRRLFLQSLGKWSGAAIVAAVAGAWLGNAPQARAGAWVNRRGVGGGGWVNRVGGGGGWVNGGGGGWINRRVGGAGWINRF
jgi:hypothetical protein